MADECLSAFGIKESGVFFAQLDFGISYSLIILNSSYYALKSIFTDEPPSFEQLFVANIYGFLIILPAISIYFGIHFLQSWKRSEVEAERLQKESIKSQLDALKDHLDPHFLFNNLNILSSLIDKSKEQSKAYLDKFADVYRFILQNENSELIPLSRELEFLESYVYLIKIRFEDTISIEINIPDDLAQKTIPPLTLQMLLENAIKHNMVTEIRPLRINFGVEDDYIAVVNNLQEKKINGAKIQGSGLKNIKDRYSYFTQKEIVIKKEDSNFIVKVPLLEIDTQ